MGPRDEGITGQLGAAEASNTAWDIYNKILPSTFRVIFAGRQAIVALTRIVAVL